MKIIGEEIGVFNYWNDIRIACYTCEYDMPNDCNGSEIIVKSKRQVIRNIWVKEIKYVLNAKESILNQAIRNRLLKEFGEILTLDKLDKCLIKMGFYELRESKGATYYERGISLDKYKQLPIKFEE